jgi:uncharacterized protein RhaS with RHS repeats
MLQRFVNEDPIGLAGGINVYAYVENNPVNALDPLGLCSCLDLNRFVRYLDRHALPEPKGKCGRHIREALEDAGANSSGHPQDAKDWGPFLVNNLGFSDVTNGSDIYPGDIAVFQPVTNSNISGHIEAWDGTQWVSDYQQGVPLPNGTHFYPNLARYGPQPYQIYRYHCGCN